MHKTLFGVLVLFPFLLGFTNCADHDTFKDCSRVDYCSNLRTRNARENYVIRNGSLIIYPEGSLGFTLDTNDGSPSLNLTVYFVDTSTFRFRITELNSTRYQLKDVINEELDPLRSRHMEILELEDRFEAIVPNYTVKININPFSLEFEHFDEKLIVFDGAILTLEQDLDQAFAFGVSFPQAVQLYGIPEHTDSLALQTTGPGGLDPYRLRNLDVSGHELNSPIALYGSIPVLYGHGTNGTAGIFLHNAAEQWYDINNENSSAYVMVESGELDIFTLLGPTPTDVVRQYVQLTGPAHLPQLWALGHHQSRWSYMSQDDVKDVVANFTNYNFPLDVIWLDIDYTDDKKYFTWNPENFSDPVELQQNISAAHKRLVTIIDPHIKVEEGYNLYDGALENNFFVTLANGSNFEGICWPGLSSYLDFLNPETQNYYASFYNYENFPGSTSVLAGIWNDMNEPSVFDNSLEKTLPGDALHYGGVLHRDVHNIYGFLQTKATHQGLLDRDNGTKRPFILTRSHFAGTQRYSAVWTGDNSAEWGHLSISYDQCLNANLLGIVFCGADVGGFAGEPSEELLQRWYQAGAWLPFYRAHSAIDTNRREPYLFDADVQEVIREAIQLRYRHLPVWYTLFYEHTRNLDPIIRPLFYQYPTEEDVFRLKDHLLLGRDILVRAVSEPGVDSVEVYFPGGSDEQWLSITNTEIYGGNGLTNVSVDLKAIPVYYRRGSIITIKDTPRLNTDEMINDDYTLLISLGQDNKATGNLYYDDFTSFDYLNYRAYNYLRIDADGNKITLTPIDESANINNFTFAIDKIVVNKVLKVPSEGNHGRYEKSVFKTDVDKKLLKEFKFGSNNTITIRLPGENQ